jgi:hypothetical protein
MNGGEFNLKQKIGFVMLTKEASVLIPNTCNILKRTDPSAVYAEASKDRDDNNPLCKL